MARKCVRYKNIFHTDTMSYTMLYNDFFHYKGHLIDCTKSATYEHYTRKFLFDGETIYSIMVDYHLSDRGHWGC